MIKKPDSVTHHEERHAKMREEAAEQQAAADEAKEHREHVRAEHEQTMREAETQELEQQAGLVKHGETREMLLERIRKLREEPPKEETFSSFMTPELQKRLEAEQQAGREAVARAEVELEKNRELWRKQEEEEKAKGREPTMETVHHPNPSQNEVFPTSKPR